MEYKGRRGDFGGCGVRFRTPFLKKRPFLEEGNFGILRTLGGVCASGVGVRAILLI